MLKRFLAVFGAVLVAAIIIRIIDPANAPQISNQPEVTAVDNYDVPVANDSAAGADQAAFNQGVSKTTDNQQDQTIVNNDEDRPLLASGSTDTLTSMRSAIQESLTAYRNLDACLTHWIDMVPGSTTRKQAEDFLAERCRGEWDYARQAGIKAGLPNAASENEGDWRAQIRQKINDEFGDPLDIPSKAQ